MFILYVQVFGLKCYQGLPGAQVEGDCGGQEYCAKFSVKGNGLDMTGMDCGNATNQFSKNVSVYQMFVL